MKKYLASILSLILALAMVFTLVACGGDDSSSDDDDDDSSSSKASSSQSSDDSSDESEEESKEPVEVTDGIVGNWKGACNAEGIAIDLEVEFKDDGKYVIAMDMEDYYVGVIQLILDAKSEQTGEEYTYEMYLEAQGTTDEELRASFEEELNGGILEGEYEFDGDKFVFEGYDCEFELNGDEFAFIDEDGAEYLLERA